MASNTIHFIDLFYFLKKIKKKIIVTSSIKKVILSKRNNYNELLGSIDLIDEDGNRLFLEDSKKK